MRKVFVTMAAAVMAGSLLIGLSGCNGDPEPAEEVEVDQVQDAVENQQYCPVMEGMEIDESIYADHEGERVYFCCNSCAAEFANDPDKYLEKVKEMHAED